MSASARERLVLALDVPSLDQARSLIDELAPHVGVFKVGLQLFMAAGPEAVAAVHAAGAECFLDLKLHDIPATMVKATRVAAGLGVRFLTVHALAGSEALAAVSEARGETEVLAVTVLTSADDATLRGIGLSGTPAEAVARLGALAVGAGAPGLVCSPLECGVLRDALGPNVTLMVPGVRPAGSARGDQKRVMTPGDAIRAGADYLVVGRPIRDAADRVASANAIVREIEAAIQR